MERFFSSLPVIFFVILGFTLSASFASANTCTYSCHRATGAPLDHATTGGECTGTDAGPCAAGCATACAALAHPEGTAYECAPTLTRCQAPPPVTPITPPAETSEACRRCVSACVEPMPASALTRTNGVGTRIYECTFGELCTSFCSAEYPPLSGDRIQNVCVPCLQGRATRTLVGGTTINATEALRIANECREDQRTASVAGLCQPVSTAQTPAPSSSGGSAGRGSATRLYNPLGSSNLYQLIARLIRTMTGLVGALALGMFVVGGIIWLTAGDTKRVDLAKEILKNSTIGLILIFLSYAVVSVFLDAVTSISH